jgi:hypothetical protein
MTKPSQAAIEMLDDRLEGLMDRLKQVEMWCAQHPGVALEWRYIVIEEHLKQLEQRLGISSSCADSLKSLPGVLYHVTALSSNTAARRSLLLSAQ